MLSSGNPNTQLQIDYAYRSRYLMAVIGKQLIGILWRAARSFLYADQLIMPEGTIDYYHEVVNELGGGYLHTKEFARLFMAPGVGHCENTGTGPKPQNPFDYVVNWVENGVVPETIPATKTVSGGTQTRPLCPYPDVAVYTGQGSTDDAANFECKRGKDNYPHDKPQT
jgi:hypothetical protein